MRLDGGGLRRLERAERVGAEIGADVLAAGHAGTTPISSSTRRSERSAYQVRLFTVPTGSPVSSRDLTHRHTAELGHSDHLPVLGRQPLERGGDLPAEHRLLDRAARVLLLGLVRRRVAGRTAARRRASMIALRAIR